MKTIYFLLSAAVLWTAVFAANAPLPKSVSRALEHGFESKDRAQIEDSVQRLEEYLQSTPYDRRVSKVLAMMILDGLHEPVRAVSYLEKIVEDAPESVAWNYCLGRAYKEAGRVAKAELIFTKVTTLQPENTWAWYQLGNIFSDTGRFSEAIDAYHSALAGSNDHETIQLSLARVLWSEGRIPESVEAARRVLEHDAENEEAGSIVDWGQGLLKKGREDRGPAERVSVNDLEQKKQESPDDRALADAYCAKSTAAFEHAARLLSAELVRSPSNVGRRKTLAFLYLDVLHSPQRALPHLKAISRREPGESGWWEMLARAQSETGDWPGAVGSYRSVIRLQGGSVWLFYHLARAEQQMGSSSEARGSFEKALQLEPQNVFVRRELARCYFQAGQLVKAEGIARGLVVEGAGDADAHAILGDVARMKLNFRTAQAEYNEALSLQQGNPFAANGMNEMERLKRLELGAVYYAFKDTDGFTQSGVFTHASVPVDERLKSWFVGNERFFAQSGFATIKRFEGSLGADYWLFPEWKLSGGGSVFSTEDRGSRGGGNVALYFQPDKRVNSWVMQQVGEPVNDSYTSAREALSQSVLSAGVNFRANKQFVFSILGSRGDYADGNARKRVLGGVSWYGSWIGTPVLRVEGEWIDYAFQSERYSSPGSYTRVRPSLEWGPRLNDWLRAELHGEVSYVCDLGAWGTGLTAGLRFNRGEAFDVGGSYMKYEIPGGQSTWSGSGFKLDVNWRF